MLHPPLLALGCLIVCTLFHFVTAFAPPVTSRRPAAASVSKLVGLPTVRRRKNTAAFVGGKEIFIIVNDDDEEEPDEEEEEEDEEELEEDPYTKAASTEFTPSSSSDDDGTPKNQLARSDDAALATTLDWGGALGKLRQRVEDIEGGKTGDPSRALFRLLSSESPNQSIGSFVQTAKPQVVQAMSGAINSLLGGLSSPQSGVEMVVKATGDKIGSLCFQLQMTGYVY